MQEIIFKALIFFKEMTDGSALATRKVCKCENISRCINIAHNVIKYETITAVTASFYS